MSIKVMAEVWGRSRHSGTNLLMMLALADFSDDQGNSYPAVPTLAVKCRMQPRNATYILRDLERSGELEVTPNGGPKGTNRYRIALEALGGVQSIAGCGMQHGAPLQSVAPLQSSVSTPAMQRRLPLQPIADEPSLNHQEPKKERAERTSRPQVMLKTWLEEVDARGEDAIPDTDPVFSYADAAGIPADFLRLAWSAFKTKMLASGKKQKDWRATFRVYVREGYLKLWFVDSATGEYRLTTAGQQALRVEAAHG